VNWTSTSLPFGISRPPSWSVDICYSISLLRITTNHRHHCRKSNNCDRVANAIECERFTRETPHETPTQPTGAHWDLLNTGISWRCMTNWRGTPQQCSSWCRKETNDSYQMLLAEVSIIALFCIIFSTSRRYVLIIRWVHTRWLLVERWESSPQVSWIDYVSVKRPILDLGQSLRMSPCFSVIGKLLGQSCWRDAARSFSIYKALFVRIVETGALYKIWSVAGYTRKKAFQFNSSIRNLCEMHFHILASLVLMIRLVAASRYVMYLTSCVVLNHWVWFTQC